jgi:ParB-like partition proteins
VSAKKAGLGRGLGSLGLDQKREVSSIEGITLLAVTSITANPRQARQIFDEEALQALADSIRRYGVVQPIVVRPLADKTYELIAGERRWRASQRAGLKEIPALIRTYEDTKATEISLIENIQRENLNVIEEAAAYKLLIDMNNWKQDELAAKVGKSRSHVANIMRLLSLAPPVRKLIENGALTMGQARPLLQLKSPEVQEKVAQRIVATDLSARQAETLVKHLLKGKKKTVTKGVDTYIEDLQDRLKMRLGTNVAIRVQKGNTGKIEISFSSEAEFERLLALLTEENEKNRPDETMKFTV